MSSPTLSAGLKYTHVPMRVTLLRLLEAEGCVTRYRMADALGVSRMTAQRISEQLLSEGLIMEVKGHDPVSGRMSRLLTLTPDPDLLLLDARPESPTMTAYHYQNRSVSLITADYRLTLDLAGNFQHLDRLARPYGHLEEEVPRICLRHTAPSPTTVPLPFREITEEAAVAQVLNGHPLLCRDRTLLHLKIGAPSADRTFVRQCETDPWFSPFGSSRADLFSAEALPDRQAITAYLADYVALVQPDVILLEHPLTAKDRHAKTASLRQLVGYPTLSPVEDDLLPSFPSHGRLLRYEGLVPLWVWGAVSLQRMARWLAHTEELT